MNNNIKLIHELIIASLEGAITEAQVVLLKQILRGDDEAARYYVEISSMISQFRRSEFKPEVFDDNALAKSRENLSFDSDLWKSLAENEIQAPKVESENQRETPELIEKITYKENPRRFNKFSLYSLIVSIAALLLLIIYVKSNPIIPVREVATLTDSINAQWAETFSMQNGTRLSTARDCFILNKGVAELLFDSNAKAVIEAPAKFELKADDRMVLLYGRLYAVVPPEALGFTVTTPNSKIIDLGTEFGVYFDSMGDTELHVFRGKTKLVAGSNSNALEVMDILNGHAIEVNQATQKTRTIELSRGVFARDIDSQTNRIWRGETIDLADIVGGGNGLQTGQNNTGIDWSGQTFTSVQTSVLDFSRETYIIPVADNPFIDCIFVPSGDGQKYATMTSNTTELNLDDFIRRDTNGLITLMLTHEISDSDNSYWFSTKEVYDPAPDILPALIFPQAGGQSPVIVTTADRNGADTYLTNDVWQSSDSVHGTESSIPVRHFREQRIKIAMFRFDIRDLGSNRQGAILRLHVTKGTRSRNLNVYGIKDGPADNWDENTVCYNTAPGLEAATVGTYKLDTNRLESLGTFPVVDTRIRMSSDWRLIWAVPDSARPTACVNPMPGYPVTCGGTISLEENGIWRDSSLMMSDIRCGKRDNPSILLAANGGITFDLEAIRTGHGNMKITAFTATCGVARMVSSTGTAMPASDVPRASMYILVNGSERYAAIDKTPADEPQSIRIDLTGNEKYLTLVSTQGSDGSNQNDLCVFLKPTLQLEP